MPAGTSFELHNATPSPVHTTAITTAGFLATLGDKTLTPPWSV